MIVLGNVVLTLNSGNLLGDFSILENEKEFQILNGAPN